MSRWALVWIIARSLVLYALIGGAAAGVALHSVLLGVLGGLAVWLLLGAGLLAISRRRIRRGTPSPSVTPPAGGWRRWDDDDDSSDTW